MNYRLDSTQAPEKLSHLSPDTLINCLLAVNKQIDTLQP